MLAMSPSRNASKRQALALKNAKRKKPKKVEDDSTFALNAGFSAALEEVQAEERDIRKVYALCPC
jgi:hypothetical protein